jgi:hypothetical protein
MVPSAAALTAEQRRAAESLASDLRVVFGTRLHSVVAYGLEESTRAGGPVHTMALVERITFEDLIACAPLAATWGRRGLSVPLLLGRDELARSLDAFALEYGAIAASHVLIEGHDPFAGMSIAVADLRRACERQAKGHLIHLREGFLESGADPKAVAALIAASAPAFEAVLVNIARLTADVGLTADTETADLMAARSAVAGAEDPATRAADAIGLPPALLNDVRAVRAAGTIVDPTALLSRYIAATERTWQFVDGWRSRN